MKEATIYDIAKHLGLSASTVSRALKDNPLINENTRKKVHAYAREVAYRNNSFASNLRKQKTNTIGVIVPRLESSFMSACLAGMEEVASENGYDLLITQSQESKVKEEENSTVLFNKRVDGMIVSLTREGGKLDYFKRFEEKNVPIVYFDRVPPETPCSCMVIDNERMAHKASLHLLDQGCLHLVHLTIESPLSVYRDRINGFMRAIKEGKDCSGSTVYMESMSFEDGKAAAERLIDLGADGVFAANDMVATGCLLELLARGKRIPEDIAVVGFNNDQITRVVKPNLTTIHYPGKDAGRKAMCELLRLLTDEEYQCGKVMLSPELIIRESSLRKKK